MSVLQKFILGLVSTGILEDVFVDIFLSLNSQMNNKSVRGPTLPGVFSSWWESYNMIYG